MSRVSSHRRNIISRPFHKLQHDVSSFLSFYCKQRTWRRSPFLTRRTEETTEPTTEETPVTATEETTEPPAADSEPVEKGVTTETKEKVSIFKRLFACGILKKNKSKSVELPVEEVTTVEETTPVADEAPAATTDEAAPTEESPPADDQKPEQPREEEEVKKEEDKSADPALKTTEVVDLSNKYWCGCF